MKEKLKAEYPGILAWMIQGCLDCQKNGLRPPQAVTAATDEYLRSEDLIAIWQSECTACEATAKELSSHLFANWKVWAEKGGQHAGTRAHFKEELEKRGFWHEHTRDGSVFHGIRLKGADGTASYWQDGN